MMKYLIIGKENYHKDLENHLKVLKDEGVKDFNRHQKFLAYGKIPEYYIQTDWYEFMSQFTNPFDYYEYEKASIEGRYQFKKARGDYDRFVHIGYSNKKKNPRLLTKFQNQDYLDVRIVTEDEFKKLKKANYD